MARVYLDTNVFSNLRNNATDDFRMLNNYIEKYKKNLSFFFSHAHIRDKKKDKTNFKFDDFLFIETLVGDNYISYHGLEKNTTFYLATPQMVFNDEDLGNEYDILLDFWEIKTTDDPLISAMKLLLKGLYDKTEVQAGLNIGELSENERKALGEMIPLRDDGNVSFSELLTHFTNFQYNLLTDSTTYKELRSFIDTSINDGKFVTKDGSLDFSEQFKDSVFQKSFIQFVKDSCRPDKDGNILYYDFYLTSYAALDSLGVSKEKLSNKNTFNNLFNDGLHSYYARYFDFFVTDDSGTIQKTKALYNLYDISTQVVTTKEFLSLLPAIGEPSEKHLLHFFEKFANTIKKEIVADSKEIDEGLVLQYLLSDSYLNTFDELLELRNEQGRHFYFSKLNKHLLSQPNFREVGQIIDRCMHLFGHDIGQFESFNFEKEVKEINDGTWKGRYWKIGTLDFYLHRNDGFKKLCLFIGPIPMAD